MPRLLVVDECVRERTTLVDELRDRGFDVTTTLDSDTKSLTAIVVAIDSASTGTTALPPCARSEPAARVPIIVVAADCGVDVRLQAAIEGAALWLEGRASVEAIERAIAMVAGPAAPPLPDQRRQARIAALAAVARTERASPVPDHCDVRVTRLEHAPAPTRDANAPAPHPALARCTAKQRELLDVIARAGSVTNAAIVLGTTRNNVYATLRRIAHRAGLRDSSELLRAIGVRVVSGPPRS